MGGGLARAASVFLALIAMAAIFAGYRAVRLGESRSSSALIERGAQLYNANCLECHGGATGGNRRDIPPPHNANGHTWHHPDCQLKDIVLSGGTMDRTMRDVILAYIRTWWSEEQRTGQARMTGRQC